MSHFIELCRGCGILISQCRCPGPREKRWSVCARCKAEGRDRPATSPADLEQRIEELEQTLHATRDFISVRAPEAKTALDRIDTLTGSKEFLAQRIADAKAEGAREALMELADLLRRTNGRRTGRMKLHVDNLAELVERRARGDK